MIWLLKRANKWDEIGQKEGKKVGHYYKNLKIIKILNEKPNF